MQIGAFVGEYEGSSNKILFTRFAEVLPDLAVFVEDLRLSTAIAYDLAVRYDKID